MAQKMTTKAAADLERARKLLEASQADDAELTNRLAFAHEAAIYSARAGWSLRLAKDDAITESVRAAYEVVKTATDERFAELLGNVVE